MVSRRDFALFAALILLAVSACTADDPGAEPNLPPGATDDLDGLASPSVDSVTEPVGDWFESSCAEDLDILRRTRAGLHRERGPEIVAVPREPNYFGGFATYTHSGPWDYTQRVPLALYGPGFIKSQGDLKLKRRVTLADVAPTLAELVGTELPGKRPGRAITEALVDESRRGQPKLIVQLVWDGGGTNVLEQWPEAWPTLKRIMAEGTSVQDVEVGASPSVTPAVHATIGTGAFPRQHGIVGIRVRDGDRIISSSPRRSPAILDETTVADVYDQQVDNQAKVGLFSYKSWHWHLAGHGSMIEGGDRDIVFLSNRSGVFETNPRYYEMPDYVNEIPGLDEYTRQIDISDGEADGLWIGNDILDTARDLRNTPAWTLHQTDVATTVMEREGFGDDDITDLFFMNYKQIDEVGHRFNMLEPESRSVVEYTDAELEKLMSWLDRNVGKREWVLMVTADHGQGPDPIRVGAWPVRKALVFDDIEREFDVDSDALFQDGRPGAYWIDNEVLETAGMTLEDIAASFNDHRLEENVRANETIPALYQDRLREPIFSSAWPTSAMGRVWNCAKNQE